MMGINTLKTQGMEWLFNVLDFRDDFPKYERVKPGFTEILNRVPSTARILSAKVDHSIRRSPIEDQRPAGYSMTYAGGKLMGFYERKSLSTYIDASRPFLYLNLSYPRVEDLL